MASEWPQLSLREANVSLIDCDHRTPPAAETGYPYVAIPQLRGGRIDLSDVRLITPEHFEEWTKKARPTAHDVILSRRCNPGETAYVPPEQEFALGQNLVILRADGSKVYPPFLRWLVRGPEWWDQIAKFLNVGAVFDSLKCADVPNFTLTVPPLREQRAIAHVLGTLDGKVECLWRMSETLEAMARALFRSWFVDFDPVRAKAERRDPGLPKPVADLFPDCFDEDSAMGEIPRGWESATLSDFADLNSESWSDNTAPDTVRYINLASTKWGSITSIAEYAWHEAPSRARRVLRPWDAIVGTVRPGNGSYTLVIEQGLTGSTAFAVLRPREPRYRSIVYLAATSVDNIERLSHLADGAAYPAIRPDVVSDTRLVSARSAVLDRFARIADPLLLRMAAAEQESRTLAALRDVLLPRIISGELRVKDADKFVKAAV